MKQLLIRTLTGVAYVAVLVFGTVSHPWALLALIVLLALLAVWELARICSSEGKPWVTRLLLALSVVTFAVAVWLKSQYTDISLHLVFAPYLLVVLLFFVNELYARRTNPIAHLGLLALAQVYIVLPLSLLSVLAFAPLSVPGRSFWALPLALYFFIWLNDTGAYLIGSWLGRHKLFPRISPGKTWEGSIGGAISALLAAVLMAYLFPFMNLWRWLGLAMVVVVFGTWGDLTESLIKRSLGIKDSGNLLPGHGGILDRIDSMLFAVPAAVVYLCF